ncbi:MAG: serine hydrolase [Anaerovoracaceae bacterium]|nr:serine hydrolase [Anaerovoracaceae bacterium]
MILADKIKDRISNVKGRIGIYFYDIDGDKSIFTGNCDVFASWGIAKLMVMTEVFKQVEEGKINLRDEYVLEKKAFLAIPEKEREATVGILDFLHEGLRLTIEDLLYMMIVISDNCAFDILLSFAGMDNVNNTLKSLGLVNTKINCFLSEADGRKTEENNHHSVREVGSVLKRLYKRQLISAEASDKMFKMLSYHQRRDVLSVFSNNNISVAQQTGFDQNALHEAAIVMTEKPFIICMSADDMDSKKAEKVMRDVADMCGREMGMIW